MYDFASTSIAGLFQRWPSLYRFARAVDELMIRVPLLKLLGSNFELIAASHLEIASRKANLRERSAS
jgi:hypothetical protein